MTGKKAFTVLVIMFLLTVCGCKDINKQKDEQPELLLEDIEWRDNSLDAYSAEFAILLRHSDPEEVLYGGAEQYVLGNDGAAVFKKHLFQEATNDWDEVKTIHDNGDEKSFRLAFWKDRKNQAWAMGSIFNSNHYLLMNMEVAEDRNILYRLIEVDENMKLISDFYVNGLDEKSYEFPEQMKKDVAGNIHILTLRSADNTPHYYIISMEGARVIEVNKIFDEKENLNLFYLYDGSVGLRKGGTLLLADIESGNTKVLSEVNQDIIGCVLWDEKMLLLADNVGVYRQSILGGDQEMLYEWSKHGMVVAQVYDMQVSKNKEIRLLYATQDGCYFVELMPTSEEVPILKIEFAVSSIASKKYQTAVTTFNKRNPVIQVNMKTYAQNDSSLLTKLIAGEGPQLIDSTLMDFKDNEKLWERLDGFYDQLKSDLIPETVEMGKIDGMPYGVIPEFYLNTVVTFAESPEEWDYVTFLDCLTENEEAKKAVCNAVNGAGGYSFVRRFFCHDLDESFLYDANSCKTQFYGKEFQRILELADYYENKDSIATVEDLRQRVSPCAVVNICRPEDLACLRIWSEGKLRYIGFPTQNGSAHYMIGAEPLCVNKKANSEEKQLAIAFLRFLLSYETQKESAVADNPNYHLSVRWDVLNEQFDQMDETTKPYVNGFPQFAIGDGIDREKDYETLKELLEKARPRNSAPVELDKILAEELEGYFNKTISAEDLKRNLTNRVELYLHERKN